MSGNLYLFSTIVMVDPEMVLGACKPSQYAPIVRDKEVEEVFGRYPENVLNDNNLLECLPFWRLYEALMDLDIINEPMAAEGSFELGGAKPVTACYNRILSFIDYFIEKEKSLNLNSRHMEKKTLKKYQVEVLLNAVRKCPLLVGFELWNIHLDDDCWKVVGEILATCSTWERVVFYNVFTNATSLGLFARSLAMHLSSMTYLDLSDTILVWNEEVAEHIKLIFEYCPNLERIDCWGEEMTLDAGRMIGHLVANKKSLSKLGLGLWHDVLAMCNLLNEAFKAHGSLKQLEIYGVEFGDNLEWLIHGATCIETLKLNSITFGCNSNPQFFRSLKTNIKLKHLTLCHSSGLENLGSFENLMDAVRGSMSLESIDLEYTDWSVDGKAALVKEALDQRVRQRDYLSVLSNELKSLSMRGAISGRIYLCRQPFAGKNLATLAIV